MSVRESCWMLVSAFLFALMALFAKLSTAYYGVMEIIFYRSVLGVLLSARRWPQDTSASDRTL